MPKYIPQKTINVRIPQIIDVDTAIRLYYSKTEISNAEIRKLFGNLGQARISKLKQLVINEMCERDTVRYNALCVNTEVAYDVWGINIDRMTAGRKKLQQLGLGG